MSEKTAAETAPAQNLFSCEIDWHDGENMASEEIYDKAPRANLLQSRTYALCMAALNNQRLRRGVVMLNGRPAGMLQTLEAGLFRNAVHAVIIDRAPVWEKHYGAPEHFAAFLAALRTEYPRRFGRRIRFIPECDDRPENSKVLERLGFRRRSNPYRTLWWDLRPSSEDLRNTLKPGWRGALQKAEKIGLNIDWDSKGRALDWFMAGYASDKEKKGYPGASARTLKCLAHAFLQRKNALIGRASLDGQAQAGVIIFCHGQSATYQAGWTTPSGRRGCAHHYLLWSAAQVLKEREIYDFDLGGIEAELEGGIRTFKEGTGGAAFQTPGLWI